jgi:hypothetical protein
MQDAAHHASIIDTQLAGLAAWKMRLDHSPSFIQATRAACH